MAIIEKDLIIIGGGINGLSAGLAYALNSDLKHKKVVIIEKNPISGGYVASFTRKGYRFDTCQMASNISDILDYYGIGVDFHEFTENFVKIFRVYPDSGTVKTYNLYSGETEFEAQFYRLFPAEAGKLKKMFAYSQAMFREIYGLKYAPNPADIVKMLFTCPKVIRQMNRTFSAYLKQFDIDNPEIELLFQVFSGMCGLPNHRIAALLTVGVVYSLREKAYRPAGAFIELPRKMEQRYLELGGEILRKTEVAEILIERGAVTGVRLKDGAVIYSRNVISTVDVKTTRNLIGVERALAISRRWAKKLTSVEMTTSSFNVNLGLDDAAILTSSGLYCGYALVTNSDNAFSKLFPAFERNEFKLSRECFYIGLSCPPPVDGGKPVLTIQAIPVALGQWANLRNTDRKRYLAEKEQTAELLIDIIEEYILPGLRRHIVVKDISTPATFVRYSGSPSGSIFDMAAVPENFGAHRLPVKTPIRGLLLPKFAHGLFGAMNSGLQAVDVLLNGKVMRGNSRFKKR